LKSSERLWGGHGLSVGLRDDRENRRADESSKPFDEGRIETPRTAVLGADDHELEGVVRATFDDIGK
jgi:hypothetical protein